MKWILWREYRLNRWILATGVALLVLSYVLAALIIFFSGLEEDPGAGFTDTCSILIIALLAGNSFAGERVDRSAEFVASLPLERSRLLAGKLILCLGTVVVLGIANSLMLDQPNPLAIRPNAFFELVLLTSATLLCFSVSWCLSAVQPSPALATSSGLIVAILTVTIGIREFTSAERGWLIAAILTIAIATFWIGTRHFLRRSEP